MVLLIKILQVILALSLLIVIHEFGHFTFAKLFGIRVEKFFLFFDVGGTKLFSTKGRLFTRLFPKAKDWETEYGIGWLPLGGYCKISGMIDESMDTDAMKKEPQPWEFRTKKAWQRLLVMVGGVLYNFVFAIIAYIGIMAIWGSAYISNEGSQIYTNELGTELGFRNGDHIIRMDDYIPENFGMLQADLARRDVNKVTVLRDRDTVEVYIDRSMIGSVLNTPGVFDLAVPFVIDSVMSASPNALAGLLHGDRIFAIDSVSTPFVQDSKEYLSRAGGKTVTASILRGADTLLIPLQVDTAGRLGVYMQMPGVKTQEYSLASAIPAGFKLTFSTIEAGFLPEDGSLQVGRQLHRHRAGLSGDVGLVPVPEYSCAPFDHAGRDEPSADSGARRRTHRLLHLRDDHRPQAKRQVPGGCPDHRHAPSSAADGAGVRERHQEAYSLAAENKREARKAHA